MRRVTRRSARVLMPVALSGAAVFAAGGIALAASGGGYSPSSQGCTGGADANNLQGAEPGCHNLQVLVQDGNGNTYAEAGTYQEAQGDNPHKVGFDVNPNGKAQPTGTDDGSGLSGNVDTNWQPATGSCGLLDELLTPVYVLEGGQPCTDFTPQPPTQAPSYSYTTPNGTFSADPSGLTSGRIYFGSDDNLDTGEHDAPDGNNYNCTPKKSGGQKCKTSNGTQQQDGASDGGAVQIQWHPLSATGYSNDLAALMTGNAAPIASDPLLLASLSGGACADGICMEATTARQTLYNGGGGSGDSRDAYNYTNSDGSPHQFDPYNCSSGSQKDQQSCGSGGEAYWYQQEAKNVYAEPGVQIYEDPDPNGSPALPADPFYPLPAAYVGTCGVTVGSEATTGQLGSTPVSNSAGQISVNPTGC